MALFRILFIVLAHSFGYAQLVTNTTELNSAINAAVPGTTITLADGTWDDTFIEVERHWTG